MEEVFWGRTEPARCWPSAPAGQALRAIGPKKAFFWGENPFFVEGGLFPARLFCLFFTENDKKMLYFLFIGLAAGWLAGKLTKGEGFGLLGNLLIGVCGSMIGGWLFSFFGLSGHGLIGSIATATVGALALLFLAGKVKR
jgi:uncharacterized membrane protein YeaQ/YmgE (transglycosylase-associated protein family)